MSQSPSSSQVTIYLDQHFAHPFKKDCTPHAIPKSDVEYSIKRIYDITTLQVNQMKERILESSIKLQQQTYMYHVMYDESFACSYSYLHEIKRYNHEIDYMQKRLEDNLKLLQLISDYSKYILSDCSGRRIIKLQRMFYICNTGDGSVEDRGGFDLDSFK